MEFMLKNVRIRFYFIFSSIIFVFSCKNDISESKCNIEITLNNIHYSSAEINDLLDSMQVTNTPISEHKDALRRLKTITFHNYSEDSILLRVNNSKILFCPGIWYADGDSTFTNFDGWVPGLDELVLPGASTNYGVSFTESNQIDSVKLFIKIKRIRGKFQPRIYTFPVSIDLKQFNKGVAQSTCINF